MLPGAPGCLVVVTSRNQMPSLVAVEGAYSLTLDLLTAVEARQLLVRRVGKAAVSADPEAVDEVIRYCAGLPLALVITAARATIRRGVSFADLVQELHEARGGLDSFDGGDAVSDVRAVFSWSYRTLNADASRLFRLLGLHPGPDVSIAAIASLAALPVEQASRLVAELTRAHLLTEHVAGRFAFHDLLRVYAGELARSHESEAEQLAGLLRLLDHYLFSAFDATLLLDPHRHRISLPTRERGVEPETFAGAEQALVWFAAEHSVLVAVIRLAAEVECDSHVWRLAWTVATYLSRRGSMRDWITAERAGLTAAQHVGGPADLARAHRGLASAYSGACRYDEAYPHFRHAIDAFAAIGDLAGEAHTRRLLCWALDQEGRHVEALHHMELSRDLFQATGDLAGYARALNGIGWTQAHLGDYERALTNCRQAFAAFQELDDTAGKALTHDSLGFVCQLRGRHEEAISHYERAIDMYREIGIRADVAKTFERLGDIHREVGDGRAAKRAWMAACEIFDELELPDAERLAKKLDALATDQDAR